MRGEADGGRQRRAKEARARGGDAMKRKGRASKVDSYLPVRPYSKERVRPWEM